LAYDQQGRPRLVPEQKNLDVQAAGMVPSFPPTAGSIGGRP
jgi:hypothetical protein